MPVRALIHLIVPSHCTAYGVKDSGKNDTASGYSLHLAWLSSRLMEFGGLLRTDFLHMSLASGCSKSARKRPIQNVAKHLFSGTWRTIASFVELVNGVRNHGEILLELERREHPRQTSQLSGIDVRHSHRTTRRFSKNVFHVRSVHKCPCIRRNELIWIDANSNKIRCCNRCKFRFFPQPRLAHQISAIRPIEDNVALAKKLALAFGEFQIYEFDVCEIDFTG